MLPLEFTLYRTLKKKQTTKVKIKKDLINNISYESLL